MQKSDRIALAFQDLNGNPIAILDTWAGNFRDVARLLRTSDAVKRGDID